jgi:hypothetical protein
MNEDIHPVFDKTFRKKGISMIIAALYGVIAIAYVTLAMIHLYLQ